MGTYYPGGKASSTVWKGAVTRTCAGCHSSEKLTRKFGLPADRLATFQDSYHGLAGKGGDFTAANCASCHGWHDVLPSYDTGSSIHPKNLPQTCGKCHPGAQSKLAQGTIHGGSKVRKHFVLGWVETFDLFLIPLVIGGMLLHNITDYLRKALMYQRVTACRARVRHAEDERE